MLLRSVFPLVQGRQLHGKLKKSKMSNTHKLVFDNDTDVAKELCRVIENHSSDAIKQNGKFTLGVSGGSVVKYLSSELPSLQTDWSKWHVFFCDERHVAYDDPECTYNLYRQDLLPRVGLPPEQLYPIKPYLTVDEAAIDYESQIRQQFPGADIPRFDVLVLGMGPDGHTCSLFPGHPLLQETSRIISPICDSPKPPPGRVTMTYPLLNNAACVVFACCGASKADIIKRILVDNESEPLPAARVSPTHGDLYWILDKGAASKLPAGQ